MGGTEGGGAGVLINVGGSDERNEGDRMSVIQRRPSSESMSMSILEGLYRKSFSSSYKKLPQEPIKLSVLKLDGSCFHIEVMRTATVLELKEAVKSVFDDMPISWKHLWGRFCLSYGGKKLVVETECITDIGIKDGDELHFIRHASGTPHRGRKSSGNFSHVMKLEEENREGSGDIESGSIKHHKSGDNGVFSYSKLPVVDYKDEVSTLDFRSDCVNDFWSRFRKIVVFCGDD